MPCVGQCSSVVDSGANPSEPRRKTARGKNAPENANKFHTVSAPPDAHELCISGRARRSPSPRAKAALPMTRSGAPVRIRVPGKRNRKFSFASILRRHRRSDIFFASQ